MNDVVHEPEQAGLLVTEPVARLERILESLLLASELPLSLDQLHRLLGPELGVGKKDIRDGLNALAASLEGRAAELSEVASGFRIQVRADYAEWVSKLWQEKPPRMSRALLETLAIICYRQPVTRGEVEEIRGVALSPNIIRTLLERGWIREVGVKEVPGRPSLFGTTHQLLDDLNLKSLDDMPALPEIKDVAQLEAALAKLGAGALAAPPATEPAEAEATEAEDPEPIGAASEAEFAAEEAATDEPDALGDEPPVETPPAADETASPGEDDAGRSQ